MAIDMSYQLVPFTQEYLEPALALFMLSYHQEQVANWWLPSRAVDYPGIAVIEHNNLLSYMATGALFAWKGQKAAISPEYAHAANVSRKQRLYHTMDQIAAQEWVNRHIHLNLIGHFAHDVLLQETLYQLGFGVLVTEHLGDCSTVAMDTGQYPLIKEEHEIGRLTDLHIEHIRCYPQSPIFLRRLIDRPAALVDLEAHGQNGDVLFAAYEQDEACAYLIVGKSTTGGEGFLLQATNTAQIKSAYTLAGLRGKGIGKALLQHAIQWEQQQGYDRIFVAHETKNFAGGHFWNKYLSLYLYFSTRYVANAL